MLHARAVTLPLHPKRDPIRVRAPAPAHMLEFLTACGFKGDTPEGASKKDQQGAKEQSRD
jgi:hypothetical protein